MESPPCAPNRERILERLVRAEVFEQVLQARYLGTKRFSLEGVTALIPLLDQILEGAAEHHAEWSVLAMSHRGRLNVMAHVVNRPAEEIFAGFEDVDPRSVLGGGDVKYHIGATGDYRARNGRGVHIHLVSNPSHLEAVDPVAMGRTRAKQVRAGANGQELVLPIVIHGDAAFAGQGITAETLNFAGIEGFSVGGTIHILANNLIGFTARPPELHTARFAAELAKRQPIPIFHVNGEDPEAVVRVGALALEYRYRFHDDVVIDLIGYRRHGHSEVDDPTITQPLLYRKIKDHPPLWKLYGERIGAEASATAAIDEKVRTELEAAQKNARKLEKKPTMRTLPEYWSQFAGGRWLPEYEVDTGLDAAELGEITDALTRIPQGFHIHPKIKRLLEQRAQMGHGKAAVDYGMAEALAFGSLLRDGVACSPHRPGQPARHLQPAPCRAGGHRERTEVLPAGARRGRSGALRGVQLRALRSRGAGLRVRLQPRFSRDAGAVGGAIWRLRQRRAGDHRPVHQLGRGQVEPALRAGAAAAPRLRRPGSGALQRAHRALPATGGPGQHANLPALHRGAVLSPAAAAGAAASGASR